MISVIPILKRSYSVPRHSAAAGLRHDKLSIRTELFMANHFDYMRSQQVKKYGPGRAWLPEVVVIASRSGDELDNIVKEKSRPKADNTDPVRTRAPVFNRFFGILGYKMKYK